MDGSNKGTVALSISTAAAQRAGGAAWRGRRQQHRVPFSQVEVLVVKDAQMLPCLTHLGVAAFLALQRQPQRHFPSMHG